MLCFVVRVGMMFILGSRNMRAEETKDKYEDLIYSSMRSIVSLDELVTELSVQVAKLTTSLSVIKLDGEKTRMELEHTKAKISTLEDYDISMLEKKVEGLNTALSVTTENFGDIREDVDHTKTKVEKLEENEIPTLKNAIDELVISVADTNAKVDEIDEEVALVSGEEEAGSSKCIKVCAGTTGRESTDWINYNSQGIYTDVDIGSCGFVKTPTVTTSLEGRSYHWTADGTSAVYSVSPTGFRIYIYNSNLREDFAKNYDYNVEWISVGYTC